MTLPARLSLLQRRTGIPVDTLRRAILAGELRGFKRAGAWHAYEGDVRTRAHTGSVHHQCSKSGHMR